MCCDGEFVILLILCQNFTRCWAEVEVFLNEQFIVSKYNDEKHTKCYSVKSNAFIVHSPPPHVKNIWFQKAVSSYACIHIVYLFRKVCTCVHNLSYLHFQSLLPHIKLSSCEIDVCYSLMMR